MWSSDAAAQRVSPALVGPKPLEASLAELRQSFDMLVLEAFALLPDVDPPLAGAMVASREFLWGLLSDPAKFGALQSTRARPRMNVRISAWIGAALSTVLASLPSRATDDAASLEDPTAVIALLGLPCGQVVSVTRLKDDDRIAVCHDGKRDRVFADAEDRVVAQKQ